MKFEVYHRGLLGRTDVIAVDMIHYPGLWGLCFSHHPPHNNHPRYAADTTTAGVLRFLEAAHNGRDGLNLNALADHTVTTHHVDADAVLPVWALFHPDEALARREMLERIARCGDLFIYLDDESAKVNFTIEELHRRLRGTGMRGERVVDNELTRQCFARLLPELESILDDPSRHVELWEQPLRVMHSDLEYLARPEVVTEIWSQHTSLIESDHDPDTHALNTVCANDLLLVWRTDSLERRIDVRPAIAWYDLTSLPHRPRYGLQLLADRLNAAEADAGLGADVWHYQPGPVTIGASSSHLSQQTVLGIMADWLEAEPAERVSEVYRADVQEVFQHQSRHAVFTSHERFAGAARLRFQPGSTYEGLHYAGSEEVKRLDGRTVLPVPAAGKSPMSFLVSDDFYWNRAAPIPMRLSLTYEDRAPGAFQVEYDAWTDPYHSTAPIKLIGDGETRTALFHLEDARLGNSQEGGADLRITRTPGASLWIREVELSK